MLWGGVVNFGEALEQVKRGCRVAREGWNGKGMCIYLVENWGEFDVSRGGDGIRLPFIAMVTVTGCVVPWLASQSDILATDWVFAG